MRTDIGAHLRPEVWAEQLLMQVSCSSVSLHPRSALCQMMHDQRTEIRKPPCGTDHCLSAPVYVLRCDPQRVSDTYTECRRNNYFTHDARKVAEMKSRWYACGHNCTRPCLRSTSIHTHPRKYHPRWRLNVVRQPVLQPGLLAVKQHDLQSLETMLFSMSSNGMH